MLAKRKGTTATVVHGYAESLPFNDCEFDVAMGVLTIHHWGDLPQGLREMRRVAKQKIVLLTWIDEAVSRTAAIEMDSPFQGTG